MSKTISHNNALNAFLEQNKDAVKSKGPPSIFSTASKSVIKNAAIEGLHGLNSSKKVAPKECLRKEDRYVSMNADETRSIK